VINGYSGLLLGELNPSDPLRDSIQEIHKAGERAARLTQQLLAFSRKQILQPRVLDLNRVVAEVRPMLARLLGEDVEMGVDLHSEDPTTYADPHQLEQVIMNLAVNSRDAMPQGGKLLIQTSVAEWDEDQAQLHPGAPAGSYVVLAVSDTGVGMDEETRRHIFEPFFTTKEVGKGTGLGLAMVQGIVVQSGGHIEVHSEPGHGTTFRLYLPRVDAPADSSQPATVPAIGGMATVLVVEDQAEVRKYTATALKAYGYRVIQAENPGEALLLCERAGNIDLALTDVVMPYLGGRELADRLAKRWPRIKVLFMSGYTDDTIMPVGVLKNGTAFIQKPFTPEQLAVKVRELLMTPDHPTRILVADDEAGVRAFLRAVLEDRGYEVIEAADGKRALEEARAGHLDLAIMDLVMPGLEGIETIQALRKEAPGIAIIAMSGAFGGQFLEVARRLGAQAVLKKPLSADLLLTKVAEVLTPPR
jgi:two-component system cell cycle sensor histidine kinase/response regulator CckA